MSRLELKLLGPPQVILDGSAVRFELRKAMALLAYLAVTERVHRRDSLVNLLWPELDGKRGGAVLRQVLYCLNKELSKDQWLEVSPETVELRDGQDLWVDVRQFRSFVAECREHGHKASEVCPECSTPLREALELYADNFLSGFTLKDSVNFDDWQLVQDENLRLELDLVVGRLVRSCNDAGDYAEAIKYGRQWVALDHLNEEAHRRLMRAYVMNGQRPAAMRQFQECEAVLEREIGATPEAATRELFEAIKADRVTPRDRPGTTAAADVEASGFKAAPFGVSSGSAVEAQLTGSVRGAPVKLPAQLTNLIGREDETGAISTLLDQNRLLTLVGPGGSGKTRLAIHVAAEQTEHFPDGVFFVPLETIIDSSMVPQAVASVVGVPEVPDETRADTVCRMLAAREMLLVLDNFEQVVQASGFVDRLLGESDSLKVIATSREPLGLGVEQQFSLKPLDEEAAAELFAARARSVRPAFELTPQNSGDVTAICAHLDRLPLAIELAAARVKLLDPPQLLSRLERSLAIESTRNDLPERHRTMRNTVRWSYDLLSDDEKRFFARLAVFSGGFSLDAAEEVCAWGLRSDPQALLESLLNKSMTQRAPGEGDAPRFRMLETVRQVAAECLEEEPDAVEVRDAHALVYCQVAEKLGSPCLDGYRERFRTLSNETENIRAALKWCANGGRVEVGHRIVGALRWFWESNDLYTEGFEWASRYLSLEGVTDDSVLARTYLAGGYLQFFLGDHKHSKDLFRSAESHARAAGDLETEAWALEWSCMADLSNPGLHESIERRLRRAVRLFEDIGLPTGIFSATNAVGELQRMRGEYKSALAEYTKCVKVAKETPLPTVAVFANIGECQRHLGDIPGATESYRRSLILAMEGGFGSRPIAGALEKLASVAADPAQVARLIGASDAIRDDLGTRIGPADITDCDKVRAVARSRLSEADFDRHYSDGRALSIDEAAQEALEV